MGNPQALPGDSEATDRSISWREVVHRLGGRFERGDYFAYPQTPMASHERKRGSRLYILVADPTHRAALLFPRSLRNGDIASRAHVGCEPGCKCNEDGYLMARGMFSVSPDALTGRYTCHEPDKDVVDAMPDWHPHVR